jgi:nucleoside diphosphate-linked moiety X motif protein 19
MIRRKKGLTFSNAFVFPGGSMDPPDADPMWLKLTSSSPELVPATLYSDPIDLTALRVTAIRETWEETGVLLTDKNLPQSQNFFEACSMVGAAPLIEKLHYFARIIAPRTEPKRFDTTFFICIQDSHVEVDHKEADHFQWASPRFFLEEFFKGSAVLWPPQVYLLKLLTNLENLSKLFTFTETLNKVPLLFQASVLDKDRIGLVLPGDYRHEFCSESCKKSLAENFMIIENGDARIVRSPMAEEYLNSLIIT